jgi:hypothetical protein
MGGNVSSDGAAGGGQEPMDVTSTVEDDANETTVEPKDPSTKNND